MSAKLVKVIEAKITRGSGKEGDPYREVTQYWSLDGKLLAEVDPVLDLLERETQPHDQFQSSNSLIHEDD